MNPHTSEILLALNKNFSQKLNRDISGTIDYIGSGVYHDNYVYVFDQEKLLIRMNRISQWGISQEKQICYEYDTLRDLECSGVTPIPREMLKLGVGDDTSIFLVEKFIDGRNFDYKEDLCKAAESLGRIHQCKPKHNSYFQCANPAKLLYEDAQQRIKKLENDSSWLNKISHLKSYEKYMDYNSSIPYGRLVINNTDLNSGNFIISGDTCYIVDWEGARLSDCTWDIAHFVAATTTLWDRKIRYRLSEEEKAIFIQTYVEGVGIDDFRKIYKSVNGLLRFIYFRCFAWTFDYCSLSSSDINYNTIVDTFVDEGFIEACFSECI